MRRGPATCPGLPGLALLAALALGSAASVRADSAAPRTGADLVALCGGHRVVLLLPDGLDAAAAERARAVLNGRAGPLSAVVDYAVRDGRRIVVHLPGAGDPAPRIERLQDRTALTLHAVLRPGAAPGRGEIAVLDRDGTSLILDKAPVVGADGIAGAAPTQDAGGAPALGFTLTAPAAEAFGDWTAAHLGDRVAILIDGKLITAPTVLTEIRGGQGIVTGDFGVDEVRELADRLSAGGLAVDLDLVSTEEIASPGAAPQALCPGEKRG